MEPDECQDLIINKPPLTISHRSRSSLLNIILIIMACIFLICFVRFIRQEKRVSTIEHIPVLPSKANQPESWQNSLPKRNYYDYQEFLVNNTLKPLNRTRRYFYIDLGCFDGRDIDYFVHFHAEEIQRYGTLNIIAFEPDPINFSACKLSQQKRPLLQATIYNTAVWTEDARIRYAIEKGQRSKIDSDSALTVQAIDFSKWLAEHFHIDDFVYVKFTIEGTETPILEKMILDGTLSLVDNMEIEWNDGLAPDFEPRRVVLECMFDNFGMDFLYMINPVDARHAYNVKETFAAVPKDKGWYI